MKKKIASLIGAGMLLALLAMPATADDLIRVGSGSSTTTLDPIRSAAIGNSQTFVQLYARLLRRDENGNLEPGLATDWALSEDGLTLSLNLRDAKFSDNTPITAEDVAFSLTRVITDKDSAQPGPFAPVESIKADGDKRVIIRLKHRFASILDNLETFNAGIVSKSDVEKRGDKAFAENPVTSGPYMVSEWRPNERLILAANPHYWREGFPKNKGVELIEVIDQNTRVSMMMAGEVDVIDYIPWSQIASLKTREGIKVVLEPSSVINVTLLNHGRPPFDDIKVRQAAAHALNVVAIAKAMTENNAMPANSTMPNAMDSYAADMPGISYDPALAKKLLGESTYDGKEVSIVSPGGDVDKAAILLQAQWAAIGLKSKIEKIDGALWWDIVTGGRYDAVPTWWYSTEPDTAARWAVCGTCGNKSYYTQYNNPKINDLIEQASQELDKNKRAAIYHKIQEITTNEVAQIPLYYPPSVIAYSTKVNGLKLTPLLLWTFEDATLSK